MDNQRLDNAFIGQNVRQVRTARGLDLKDVSQALAELGHPLGVSALSKLETGGRKVMAEDLPYLAVVLGVTPNVLLLGGGSEDGGPALDSKINIAGKWDITRDQAWRWIQGEQLPEKVQQGEVVTLAELGADFEFQARSQPHNPPADIPMQQYQRLEEAGVFGGLNETVLELQERGYPLDVAIQHIALLKSLGGFQETARRRLRRDVDDSPAP